MLPLAVPRTRGHADAPPNPFVGPFDGLRANGGDGRYRAPRSPFDFPQGEWPLPAPQRRLS